MEKSVVRESKYRNVFSKTWKKELFYTNLKVNVSGGDDVFKANPKFFAVPWAAAGGALAVVPLKNPGKAADTQPLICGHTDHITAVEFNPFDDCIVATGSRDTTVKLWRVPEDGLTQHIKEPLSVLSSHTKKINNLSFHPIASNILLTSAGDASTRLWDIEQNKETLSLTGHEDAITSISWDVAGGAKSLATASRDKKLRLYDPRAGASAIKECVPHEGGQGFKMIWLDGRDMNFIYTVGFSKTKARQQALWDPRNIAEPIFNSLVTSIEASNLIVPYFDPATNIIFLSGKGDCISFYELEKYPPNSHYLSKAQLPSTHSSVCLLPKRVNEVGVCEIDRFLRLANNVVETVSFIVPRKTQATHFQSDLFPPMPSGQPGLKGTEWVKGTNAALPVVNAKKPEGLLEEERDETPSSAGGSSASGGDAISDVDRVVLEGALSYEVPGWFYSNYEFRYFTIANKILHCFPTKDAASPTFIIPFSEMASATTDPTADNKFTIVTTTNKTHKFQAPTQRERDNWLKVLNNVETQDVKSNDKAKNDVLHFGSLRQHVTGWMFDSNEERSFEVVGGMLCGYRGSTRNGPPAEMIHLEKVVGIHATDNVFNEQGYSFQISTTTRVLHLLTPSKEERSQWMNVLRKYQRNEGGTVRLDEKPAEPKAEDGSDPDAQEEGVADEESLANQITMEGYGQKRNKGLYGMFGMWSKCYMSLIGDDLFIFKDRKSPAPELRVQMGTVAYIRKAQPILDFHIEMENGEVVEFRSVSNEECAKWVEKLELTRKRAVTVSKLLALIGDGAIEEDDEKKQSNLLDPTLLKSGRQQALFHVKGKRRVYVCIAQLSASSLNAHNTYVLDAGNNLYQWLGAKSSRVARAKAVDVCSRIRREERGGKANVVVLEEGKTDDNNEFWKILGGKPAPSSPSQNDTAADQDKEDILTTIYWVGSDPRNNTPYLRIVEECTGHRLPKKEVLDTSGVYVVDCTDIIFCWVGKASTARPRKYGMKIAFNLASQKKRQAFVMRVLEFGETNIFKEKFANYPGMLPISTTRMEVKSNVAASQTEVKVSELVATILARKEPKPEEMPASQESRTKVWKVTEFEKTAFPVGMYGQFYSGDSYIVHYAYSNGAKDAHILYYYLGSDASVNERGTVAYLTVELDDAIGGHSVQVRVVQNKEPRHFLEIFKGKYIVHKGKFEGEGVVPQTNRLYDVRGTKADDVRVVEAELAIGTLHSAHAFILRTPTRTYVWNGKASNSAERDAALAAAKLLEAKTDNITVVAEESEPAEFWKELGVTEKNQAKLRSSYMHFTNERVRYEPRLLLCVTGSGRFEVEEELSFSQEDLPLEGAAILDTFDVVYVWLGKRSRHNIRKTSMELAVEYVKRSQSKHAPDTPILVVEPMREPVQFKTQFRAWSYSKYPKNKPIEESPGLLINQVLQHYLREVYTYDELLSDPLPPGIDARKLESYLTDEDFEKIFQMPRSEFEKIPVWKREDRKRDVFLY